MKKRIAQVLFLLLSISSLWSQEFSFRGIGLEDGLSHSRIYALLQDSRGFVWIGTSNGLNRYDGRSFRTFKFDRTDETSLPNNYVTSLIEDREGYIWVGTDGGGAAKLDPSTGRFQRYNSEQSDPLRRLSDDYVWGLMEDSSGRIWFATSYGGITLIDRDVRDVIYLKKGDEGSGLSYSNIWPMIEDRNGDVWIGTDGGGLSRYISSSGRIVHYRHREGDETSLSSDYIFSLYIDKSDKLWIGTSGGGLNLFDRTSGTFRSFRNQSSEETSLSNNSVRSIYEDSQGRFWVGTTDGLNLMDRKSGSFTRIFHVPGEERSLSHSRIHTIMEDRGGILWFGTRDGISLYSDPIFTPRRLSGEGADIPRRNDIRSILPSEKEGLYVGTYQGLFQLKGGTQTVIYPSSIIYALHKGADGSLYAGTEKGLLHLVPRGEDRWEETLLAEGVVNQILEDDQGYLWIAWEYEGLSRYDIQSGEFLWFTDEDPTSLRLYSAGVDSILFKESGNLLISSRDFPLLEMNRETLELREPSESWFQGIRSNYMARFGQTYYFALDQSGLLAVDAASGDSEIFREKDGLPSDVIRAVLPGKGRDLWISTLRGLARLDGITGNIYSFGREDGLPGLIFNPSAAASSERGLYFGSTEGLTLYSGSQPAINTYSPQMAVEVYLNLAMDSNLYREEEQVVLEADNSMVVIKLSAFDFSRPEGIRYAYSFQNSSRWIEIGNHGEVVFSHLAPGQYHLKLRASNSDGVWMEDPLEIRIQVLRPFYLRWYMIATYLILLVILVFVIIRLRSRNHIRTIRQQEELVQSRTEELLEAKEELEREISRKSMYFINLAHETKTPLTFIQNYLKRYTMRKGEDRDLKIIGENVDKLVRDMVNYLDSEKMKQNRTLYNHDQICRISEVLSAKEEVIREAAAARNMSYSSTIEENLLVQGDPLAVDRVINNLMDNALKYNSPGGEIDMVLRSDEAHVIFEVSDKGPGISESRLEKIFDPFYQSSHRKEHVQGIGMGLSIVKKILDNMNGEIFIQSREEEGTRFRIFFPRAVESEVDKEALILPASFRSPEPPVPQDVFISDEKKTLVIVDDDRDMLLLLSETLSERFNLIFSTSAEEILERVPFLRCPDLIISDVMLGGLDGHELLQRIQESPWRSAPFVFLSAKGGRSERLKGINEGAVDYISKPFKTEELVERIEARLKGQSRRREIFLQNIQETIAGGLSPEPSDSDDKIQRLVVDKELSPREEEILRHMYQGRFNKEMAAELGISVRTVEKHIYNLFRKCGVQSRIELINLIR